MSTQLRNSYKMCPAGLSPLWSKQLFMTERFLISFAMGVFALLPAYLVSIGRNEIFFGFVSTTGVVAALLTVGFCSALARCVGIRKLEPFGVLLCAAGCAVVMLNEVLELRAAFHYFLGYILQSSGWALHFTLGSVCISVLSHNKDRPSSFMVYAASSTLGFTCGALAFSFLKKAFGFTYSDLFAVAMSTTTLGSLLSVWVAWRTPRLNEADMGKDIPLARAIVMLLKGKSALFFLLVFLSGSIYTTLVNFQALFARYFDLPYELFFAFWAIGTVGSRVTIGPRVSQRTADRILPLLLGGMILSLLGFFVSPGYPILYGIVSLSIGVTYGLSYPLIQAEAVRVAPLHSRTVTQIVFSLSYFLGLHLFPFVAGVVSVHFGYGVLMGLISGLAFVQTVLALLGYRRMRLV